MTVQSTYYSFEGGLDTVSPPITIPPGRALLMQNYEPWYNGGYRRIAGFERFDGRPKPSAATYIGFNLNTVVGLVAGTTVLTGDSSGATGTFVASSGNSVAVTKVTGTFTQGETFNTAAYAMAATPLLGTGIAPTAAIGLTFQAAAEDEYRDDIAVPAGSGEVRGVWQLKDKVFAWRNNAGGTAGVMFQSSSSGWTTTGITMGKYIYFDAGTASGPFVAGTTVTGLTSGATATVHRVILHSGAWDGSAAGYLVLTGVTGTYQNNEALQVGGVTFATADGANVTFAFSINGHYQFINHNFFGGSGTYRAYGCNGVDPAFEIDENEIVSPILMAASALTGQPAANTPQYIEEHRNYLFLGFPGGSLQHSVLGEPLTFNGFLGAAEFGIGDEITGIKSMTGPTLVITSARQTRGLFGKNTVDWELKVLGEETGGKAFSTQKMDTVYGLDDLGISALSRTDTFGDFAGATVSQLIQDLVQSKKSLLNTSTVNRGSNQVRFYFSDNTALVLYVPVGSFVNQLRYRSSALPDAQFGFLKYPFPVKRIYNSEDENGAETTYFASTDGYVYQDQKGSSFDGANIVSFVRMHFHNVKSPAVRKRFRKAELELDTAVNTTLRFIADINYANEASFAQVLNVQGGGGFWSESGFNWDEFLWSSPALSSASAKLTGTGDNIGFLIYNDSATADPFVLQGLTLYYEPRRLKR